MQGIRAVATVLHRSFDPSEPIKGTLVSTNAIESWLVDRAFAGASKGATKFGYRTTPQLYLAMTPALC